MSWPSPITIILFGPHVEIQIKKMSNQKLAVSSVNVAKNNKAQVYGIIPPEMLEAVLSGDVECFEELIHSYKLDDIHKNNLLIEAIKSSRAFSDKNIVELLLSNGASSNTIDFDGKSVLMLAAEKGYAEIIDMLLDYKANINSRDKFNRNALFYAIESNAENPDIVSTLIEHNVDVNCEAKNKVTPMIIAIEKDYLKVAQLLLDNNAFVHCTNENLETPLHIAAQRGSYEAVKLLVQAGADPLKKNKNNLSAYEVCGSNYELLNFMKKTYIIQEKQRNKVINNILENKSRNNMVSGRNTSQLGLNSGQGFAEIVDNLNKNMNMGKPESSYYDKKNDITKDSEYSDVKLLSPLNKSSYIYSNAFQNINGISSKSLQQSSRQNNLHRGEVISSSFQHQSYTPNKNNNNHQNQIAVDGKIAGHPQEVEDQNKNSNQKSINTQRNIQQDQMINKPNFIGNQFKAHQNSSSLSSANIDQTNNRKMNWYPHSDLEISNKGGFNNYISNQTMQYNNQQHDPNENLKASGFQGKSTQDQDFLNQKEFIQSNNPQKNIVYGSVLSQLQLNRPSYDVTAAADHNKFFVNLRDQKQISTLKADADHDSCKQRVIIAKKDYDELTSQAEYLDQKIREIQNESSQTIKTDQQLTEKIMEKDLLIEQLAAKIEDLKKKKIEESQKSVSSKESQTHPILSQSKALSYLERNVPDARLYEQMAEPSHFEDAAIKLHEEILTFESWIDDFNKQNRSTFDELIDNVKNLILEVLPNAVCEVYGSHATELCLPWSDIDIAVKPNLHGSPNQILDIIEQNLRKKDWVKDSKTIGKTKVPVLRIKTKQVYLNKRLDITIQDSRFHALPCVELVRDYLSYYSILRPLVLVLKQFLYHHGLNDTYQGGLSSYSLILMLVFYFQNRQQYTDEAPNIGIAILNFLYTYGFEYVTQCFIVPAKPLRKGQDYTSLPLPTPNMDLSRNHSSANFMDSRMIIQDPLNHNNNVSRSTFEIAAIRNAFGAAYLAAHQPCLCDLHRGYEDFNKILNNRNVSSDHCTSALRRIFSAYLFARR